MGLLKNDAALAVVVENRVYTDESPSPVTVPYIVIRQVGPSADINYNGPRRALSRVTYAVEVVTSGFSWASANTAMRRVDELITGQKDVTQADTLILGGIRTGLHPVAERINAERINRLVGNFTVWLREAAIA